MAKVYDNATDIITFARLQSQNTTSGSSYLGSDGLLKFAAEDEPRIEYGSDGSLKGLLIEEQRTNLLTSSEDFSSWNTGNVGSLSVGGEAPDGTASATTVKASESGGSGNTAINLSATLTADTTYTLSVYAKSGTLNFVSLSNLSYTTGTGTSWFDLSTPEVALENANHTATIEDVGKQWYRLSITFATTTDTTGNLWLTFNDSAAFSTPQNGASVAHIWGVQLEEGSFPTSYIPTSGSQQTRSADVASIPVSAFGYNQDAGTWLMEWDTVDTGNVQAKYVLSSGSNARVMYKNVGPPAFHAYDGLALSTYTQPTAITFDGSHIKAAYAEDDGGSSVAHTGVLGTGSGAADLLPNYNPTYDWSIGNLNNNANFLNGHIKSLSYYPRRLTDAQLQELTA